MAKNKIKDLITKQVLKQNPKIMEEKI